MTLSLAYNGRNLLVRKASTGLTFLVVAVIVFVLAVLLSFAAGIRAALRASGSATNVLVLTPGATAESTSLVFAEEVNRLIQTPGVVRNAAGQPLISPELCVQTNLTRRDAAASTANVAVRGVDDIARDVHGEVRIIQGRWFHQGAPELIVGRSARDRFIGLEVGRTLTLGRSGTRDYTIVGVFEAGGGALESELWAPRTMLSDSYGRRFVSSVLLTIESPQAVPAALEYIKGPAVRLEARRETDYYAELARTTREIVALTTALVGIMAVGAAFAVANTMYAAVDRRRREFAMLRTLGFSRAAILASLLIESLLLCLAACLAGLLAARFVSGRREDFFSDTTYTVLAYEAALTPYVVLAAVLLASLVAVAGSLAPAIRASRIRVIDALRKA